MAQAALEHAECAVCIEKLCSAPCCFLVANGRRVCRHPFHMTCIDRPASVFAGGRKCCSLCRLEFSSVVSLPSPVTNPRGFFECLDADRNGSLSREEVIDGLKATLDLDWRRIEQSVTQLWSTWDQDHGGTVSFAEFSAPQTGLLAFVLRTYPRPTGARGEPPDIARAPREWFAFWDEDGSGALSKSEIVRALVKTFRAQRDVQVGVIQEVVDNVFCLFDSDGSGEVDMSEFTETDGLCDTIVASMRS